jgi:hypothetical protein
LSPNEKQKLAESSAEFSEDLDASIKKVSREYSDNLRFLRADLSAWYNSVASVCFLSGTIAITAATGQPNNYISHPGSFWWGTVMLLFNGVLIFLVKKIDIEGDINDLAILADAEASINVVKNVTAEVKNHNENRVGEVEAEIEKYVQDVDKSHKPLSWTLWIGRLLSSNIPDLILALLVFPIYLLGSQIISKIHVSDQSYWLTFYILVAAFASYVLLGNVKTVRSMIKSEKAKSKLYSEIKIKRRRANRRFRLFSQSK